MFIIAYKNVRHYRHTVHLYLDAIWMLSSKRRKARSSMYNWLGKQMGLSTEETHVAQFTRAQCQQAIKILRPKYIQLFGHDLEYKKKGKSKMNSEKKMAYNFLEDNKNLIQHLLEEEHYTYLDIQNYIFDKFGNYIETWWIGDFCRSHRFNALKNKSYSKLGEKNPSKQDAVREKISKTVKELWDKGVYEDTGFQPGDQNYIFNKKYLLHPNYNMIKHYREKYNYYQPEKICMCCGKDLSNEVDNIHHVDENHGNILLTNLERLCINCHQKYHLSCHKQPYVTVEIQHEIQYGHRLPDYEGKCYFDHGHRGLITLKVKRRINPETGFAIDFNDLKVIIKEEIDKVMDHEYLNNYIKNPTTENTIIWLWLKLSPVLKGIQSITFAEGSRTGITVTASDMNEVVLKGIYENEWIPEEYRPQLDVAINCHTDLPEVLNDSNFYITTSLLQNNDWLWFYTIIQILADEYKNEILNN